MKSTKTKTKSKKRLAAQPPYDKAAVDADVKASNKRFSTLNREQRKQYGDTARRRIVAQSAPPFNAAGTITGRSTPSYPNIVELRMSTDEALDIIMQAQRRFHESFSLYYGEALATAWPRFMAECPVQPGACSRQDLIRFAGWFQGPRRTNFEAAVGTEMNNILDRVEAEIIRERALQQVIRQMDHDLVTMQG